MFFAETMNKLDGAFCLEYLTIIHPINYASGFKGDWRSKQHDEQSKVKAALF